VSDWVITIAEGHREIQKHEYFLRPGYIFLSRDPTLIYTVLGSCISVCLWDRKNHFGGINHFLYPIITEPKKATANYGNVAIPALVRMMVSEGSEKSSLEAQIFGGGDLDYVKEPGIGSQNVIVARKVLNQQGIQIASEDVGGDRGRKLIYDSGTNEVVVLKIDRIRREDWYSYNPHPE
jgi:chemotaxis protein CheD